MDAVAVAVQAAVEKAVGQPVGGREIHQAEMCRKILRLAVEARGQGNPEPVRHFRRGAAEREREHRVHGVRAAERPEQDAAVRLRQGDAVPGDVSAERPEIVGGHDEEPLPLRAARVRTDDAHLMALRLQAPDQVHRRNRGAVVFFAQRVAHNRYLQGTAPRRPIVLPGRLPERRGKVGGLECIIPFFLPAVNAEGLFRVPIDAGRLGRYNAL